VRVPSRFLVGHFALQVDAAGARHGAERSAALAVVASLLLAFGRSRAGCRAAVVAGGWMLWARRWRCGRRLGFPVPLLACLLAPAAPFGSLAARGAHRSHRLEAVAQLFALLWLGVAAISLASAIVKAAGAWPQ